jgi:hypothetical protein
MIPTAARLATVKPLSRTFHFQSPVKRVAVNFAGWAVCFSVFMGWSLGVQLYEEKVNGPKAK